MIKPEILRRGIALAIMVVDAGVVSGIIGWSLSVTPPTFMCYVVSIIKFIMCVASLATE